ncbi:MULTISPECIES: MFS transporter [Clostridium]|uniref:MFS transporter n=1 Tax=Clostridium TaxID=1485 RepID=UPI000826CBF5|nr:MULTISPECIES: MFS transporter [Clostridium]PJI08023.1 MFS transporter [Clostridium sp. CT7]
MNLVENKHYSKWTILFVVVMMSFISCVDSSIVNVALPVMAKKLSVSMAEIEWVVASYVMVICASLLIFGRLGDMKGKSSIFKIGTIVFTAASLMCGFSSSLIMLLIFRVLQGIGAGAYMANNQGIITQIFPKEERGKALGILASAVALGTMIGPPVGGFIISLFSWNYIFLVNVPIGIIAFIAGLLVLPKGKNIDEKFDTKGSVLYFMVIILLFGSLIGEQQLGYKNPIIIVSFVLSIICLIVFIALQRKTKFPLLNLEIFKNDLFSLSLFCALVSFVCISASIIIIPFYLQDTLKMSSANSGLFMMIQPIIIALISPITGNMSDKLGAKILTLVGLISMSGGFLLMSFLNEHSLLINAALCIVLIALGQGFFQPANNSLIMSTVSKNKLGIAGSINSLVRNLGQMIGITLSTTILYNFMSIKIGHRVVDYVFGRDDVFVYGMRYVYMTLVFICLFGIFLTTFRIYRKRF